MIVIKVILSCKANIFLLTSFCHAVLVASTTVSIKIFEFFYGILDVLDVRQNTRINTENPIGSREKK